MAEKLFVVDADQLREIARTFIDYADKAKDTHQQLTAKLAPIEEGGFQGDTADAVKQVMHGSLLPAFKKMAEVLEELGQKSDSIATVVDEQAEAILAKTQN